MKPILCLLALASGLYTHAADMPRHNGPSAGSDSVARSYAIDDVVVSGKTKIKRLGRDVRHSMLKAGLNPETGAQCGVHCRVKQGNIRLGMLHIYCSTTQIDSLSFQLQLYDMQGDSIRERLPCAQILIPVRPGDQLTEFDLTTYDLRMDNDFLLALEVSDIKQSEIDPKRRFWTGIYFNARIGSRTYYRYQQDSTWQTTRFGFGLSVDAIPVPSVAGTAIQ